MSSVPLVSCLMLTYNFERYVADALDSVLAQDWPSDRLEVVVVDNGSTDGTRSVLARYADRVDLRLIENVPVNAAVDVYLSAARGDYFAPASGDDMWPADKLVNQVGFLEEHPDVGLVYGDMEMIDGDGNTLAPSFLRALGLEPRSGQLLGPLMHRNVVSGGSMLVRTSLIPAFHPIPPEAAWEDWWIATCVARVARIAYQPSVAYRYRRHGTNLVLGATGERLAHAYSEEARFRRWLLGSVRPGEVSIPDLGSAVGALAHVIRTACGDGAAPAAVAPLADGARERALAASAAADAAAGVDPERAVFLRAAAYAEYPHDERLLLAVADAIDLAQAAGGPRTVALADPDELLADARPRRVLALADEVVADPGLLARYAAAVAPSDGTTLVLFAPGWDGERAARELGGALARAGLDDERSPDMLALTEDDSPSVRCALAVGCEALLSERPQRWPLTGLRRWEPGAVAADTPRVAAGARA